MVVTRKPSSQELEVLADCLSQLDIFARNNSEAGALTERWRRALDEGDGMLAAFEEEGDVPLGLCWFKHTGTFVIG